MEICSIISCKSSYTGQSALPLKLPHLLLRLYITGTEMNVTCLPAVASVMTLQTCE